MPTWLKVVLIVGGLLVLMIVAAAFGLVYVAKRYGPAIVEAGKHSFEEGRDYGRRTDNEGCVTEAAARHGRGGGLGDAINNNLFIHACLDASRPTPGFCDDVPSAFEFVKSAHWQLDECKRYGLAPESQCGQLFQQVQQFCEQRRRTGTQGVAPPSPEDKDDEDDTEDSEPSTPPPPPPAPPPSK